MSLIRPNPTTIKTGNAASELRRYASEMRDSGVPVQGCAWIEITADLIDRQQSKIEALEKELNATQADSKTREA